MPYKNQIDKRRWYKRYFKKNKDKIKSYQKEYKKEYYLKNKDKLLQQNKKYQKSDNRKRYLMSYRKQKCVKAKVNEYAKAYHKKPEIRAINRVREKTRYYIKIPKGLLCQKCHVRLAKHRHHKDYRNPFLIEFLCTSCHKTIHKNENGTKKLSSKKLD